MSALRAPVPTVPPSDDIAGVVLRAGRIVILWIDGFGSTWAPVMLGPSGYVVREWGERC